MKPGEIQEEFGSQKTRKLTERVQSEWWIVHSLTLADRIRQRSLEPWSPGSIGIISGATIRKFS